MILKFNPNITDDTLYFHIELSPEDGRDEVILELFKRSEEKIGFTFYPGTGEPALVSMTIPVKAIKD